MTTEPCYNDCAEANGKRGVLLLNAIGQHNLLLWAKRPLLGGFTSRHSLQQRWQPNEGRFVMFKKCTKCQEVKPATSEYFHKDKSKNDGLRPDCKTCRYEYAQANKEVRAERDRLYNEANKEARAEYARQWRKENPGYVQEYNREYGPRYYQANKKRIADVKRQYIKANPEKRAAIDRRYHEAHPERLQERKRRWLEANPDKRREWDRRKRARRAGVTGNHTEAEWQALCSYYMDQCLCCGDVPDQLTRDHVIPITKGGSDDISNIQPLCQSCNSKKYLKIIDYRNGDISGI